MKTGTSRQKKARGRPSRPMPAPIPDTPENVARIAMQAPAKPEGGWDYLKKKVQPSEELGDEVHGHI